MLNEQINREMYSANLYLSICSYFTDMELDGFANFFKVQSDEELFHAKKMFDYVHNAGGKVTVMSVAQPITAFDSVVQAFEVTQAHEQNVTQTIHAIVKQAIAENDFTTHTFLQWFITEQLEEEALVNNLLKKLKMIGDNSSALYLLNTELAQRTFSPPSAAKQG